MSAGIAQKFAGFGPFRERSLYQHLPLPQWTNKLADAVLCHGVRVFQVSNSSERVDRSERLLPRALLRRLPRGAAGRLSQEPHRAAGRQLQVEQTYTHTHARTRTDANYEYLKYAL